MRRGRPSVPTFVADPASSARPEQTETLDGWEPADGLRGSSRIQASTSRGVHALLWTLLTGAVLLGLVSLLNAGARRGTAAGAPTGPAPTADMPPGGCAELLITAWLAGDTAVLGSLVGADVPRLPAGRRAAAHTYTVSAQPVPGAASQWAYLIGAEVINVDKKGGRSPAGVQFFTATLTRGAAGGACGGWVAPALPAQAAGLSAAGEVDLDYPRSMPVSGHPIADTVSPFFAALLAGGGEVDRYLSPGMQLSAGRVEADGGHQWLLGVAVQRRAAARIRCRPRRSRAGSRPNMRTWCRCSSDGRTVSGSRWAARTCR